jgi:RNA polymerase sigma-70 factor (sigma-E family)
MPFDEFVVSRGPALLRFAYLVCRDQGRAEDLVQDALIKAHRKWRFVAASDHPEAYVRKIVVNEFLSWRRRRASHELPGHVPDSTADDVATGVADRDVLWRALASLPARQRVVLVLRYYEDLADVQIAELLACPTGTVRSLATRAFAALRTHPGLCLEQRPPVVEEHDAGA